MRALSIRCGSAAAWSIVSSLGLASAAWSQVPVLHPSQVIEAPADPGPIQSPANFARYLAFDGSRALFSSSNNTAYIYRKTASGDWDHRATLVVPDADFRVQNVALAGDTAVLAATNFDLAGRTYVFRRSVAGWSLIQTINELAGGYGILAFDGYTIVLANPSGNGIVFVYSRTAAGTFALNTTLQEEPPPPPAALNFGRSVAVEGNTLLVGATAADGFRGAVYAYRKVQGVWQLTQVLTASGLDAGAAFGSAVALAGDTAVIAAESDDYSDDVPTLKGSAYVFVKRDGLWVEKQKIPNPTNGSFGGSVATDGRRLAISANYIRVRDEDPYGAPDSFARAFVYEKTDGVWSLAAALEPSTPSNNFALDVEIQRRLVLTGDLTVATPDPLFDGQGYEFRLPDESP
jgi:hypothetical protein